MFFKKHLPYLTLKPSKIIGIFTFAVMIVSYLYIDLPLTESLKEVPSFLRFISKGISNLFSPVTCILLLPILFFIVRVLLKKEHEGNQILFISLCVTILNAITVPLKMLFGRYRPELWLSKQLYGFDFFVKFDAEMSFPSGGALTIFSLAFALSCLFPKRFPLFFLLGLILSFSRILLHRHYFSDILASLILALFGCQLIYYSMKKAKLLN